MGIPFEAKDDATSPALLGVSSPVFGVAAMCLRVAMERCTCIGEFKIASPKSWRGEKTGKSRILRWKQLRV